jgi:hypothetical protein
MVSFRPWKILWIPVFVSKNSQGCYKVTSTRGLASRRHDAVEDPAIGKRAFGVVFIVFTDGKADVVGIEVFLL